MGKSKLDHVLSEICNMFERFLLCGAVVGGAIVIIEQIVIYFTNLGLGR